MRYLSLWPEQKLLTRDFWKTFDSTFGATTNDADFSPALDVEESEGKYTLMLDLPGIKKDEIKIEVRDNTLFISGERTREKKSDGEVTRFERYFGRFERSLSLPKSVDTENISANYLDGVLTLDIPKIAEASTKRIEVK